MPRHDEKTAGDDTDGASRGLTRSHARHATHRRHDIRPAPRRGNPPHGVPRISANPWPALVVVTVGLVHTLLAPAALLAEAAPPKAKPTREPPPVSSGTVSLPRQVVEMRDAILAAVTSGRLEDLRHAVEMNEIPPDVGQQRGEDVIAHLMSKSRSFAPQPAAPAKAATTNAPNPLPQFAPVPDGRDILDQLGKVLAARPARVSAGRDFENNAIYLWPGFAERDWTKPLNAVETAELVSLVGEDAANSMIAAKRWTGWRITIGADGTWHSLTKSD